MGLFTTRSARSIFFFNSSDRPFGFPVIFKAICILSPESIHLLESTSSKTCLTLNSPTKLRFACLGMENAIDFMAKLSLSIQALPLKPILSLDLGEKSSLK